jgi:hypothetical protein
MSQWQATTLGSLAVAENLTAPHMHFPSKFSSSVMRFCPFSTIKSHSTTVYLSRHGIRIPKEKIQGWPFMNGRFWLRFQPVDATHWANFSAGE